MHLRIFRRRARRFDPLLLFLLTVASTVYVGGWVFSATLMAILVAHEMGHYLVAKKHGVPASLPHFIPFPFTLIGTLGAVISMDTGKATKRQLLDIGAAGPIAGMVVALPAMIVGIMLSKPTPEGADVMMLGDSLLTRVLLALFASGDNLFMHPIMLAGWAGFLVTSINLVPVSQLDGGHVLFALSPERAAKWMKLFHRGLVVLGMIGLLVHLPTMLWTISPSLVSIETLEAAEPLIPYFTPGLLVIALLTRWIGVSHPEVREMNEPLGRGRKAIAWLCFAIWILTFMPNPVWQIAPWRDSLPR